MPETVLSPNDLFRKGQHAFANYLAQCAQGPPCSIELYVDMLVPATVAQFTVRRLKPGTYRAIVLQSDRSTRPHALDGHDGTRESCGAWLRSMDVPVLRVGVCRDW